VMKNYVLKKRSTVQAQIMCVFIGGFIYVGLILTLQ